MTTLGESGESKTVDNRGRTGSGRVRDALSRRVEVGDRVESVTRILGPSGVTRPERTGLVIDIFPSTIPRRSQIRVELDDEGLTEITTPSSLWIREQD